MKINLSALLIVVLINCNYVRGQEPTRNTEWLEETIDEFLNKAQNNGDPTDIQVSSCKINSKQLVATAQATIARVLKGACNPNELENRFHNLEKQLEDQLNVIKTMLISLEDKIVEQDQELKRSQKRTLTSLGAIARQQCNSDTIKDSSNLNPTQNTPYSSNNAQNTHNYNNYNNYQNLNTEADSSSADEEEFKYGGPRYDEISKYNSTVHIENGRRVFAFYWRIGGMGYKLSNWNIKRALRSGNFYIYPGGYRMYLKIIPKFSLGTMYVHTGVTKGEFDESLEWPFRLKLRVSILSNEEETGSLDLKSRLWDPTTLCSGTNWRKPVVGDNPECLGLGFTHDVIKSPEFIHGDAIVIKLTAYLD